MAASGSVVGQYENEMAAVAAISGSAELAEQQAPFYPALRRFTVPKLRPTRMFDATNTRPISVEGEEAICNARHRPVNTFAAGVAPSAKVRDADFCVRSGCWFSN